MTPSGRARSLTLVKEPTNRGGLTGIKEIAGRLGVSKQRAEQIANSDSFPAPFDDLGRGRGRIWLTSVAGPHLDVLAEQRAQAAAA